MILFRHPASLLRRTESLQTALIAVAFWALAIIVLTSLRTLHLWGMPQVASVIARATMACVVILVGLVGIRCLFAWRKSGSSVPVLSALGGMPGVLLFGAVASYLAIGVAVMDEASWQPGTAEGLKYAVLCFGVLVAAAIGGRAELEGLDNLSLLRLYGNDLDRPYPRRLYRIDSHDLDRDDLRRGRPVGSAQAVACSDLAASNEDHPDAVRRLFCSTGASGNRFNDPASLTAPFCMAAKDVLAGDVSAAQLAGRARSAGWAWSPASPQGPWGRPLERRSSCSARWRSCSCCSTSAADREASSWPWRARYWRGLQHSPAWCSSPAVPPSGRGCGSFPPSRLRGHCSATLRRPTVPARTAPSCSQRGTSWPGTWP